MPVSKKQLNKPLSPIVSSIQNRLGVNGALIYAAQFGELHEMKTLIANGADTTGSTGVKALAAAVQKNRSTFVKALIDAGAQDARSDSLIKDTALMTAVNRGLNRCVELLLPSAADLGWLNADGRSLLNEANRFLPEPRYERIAQMIQHEINRRRIPEPTQNLENANTANAFSKPRI